MNQSPQEKPNVLYVFSDQQRASAMGCYYGDEQIRTPNLMPVQRMARGWMQRFQAPRSVLLIGPF